MSALSATPRQQQLMRFIAGYVATHGRSPTYREMGSGIGVKNKSDIHRLLNSLEERGHIRRQRYEVRAIEVLEAPVIPHAPDGAPLYAVQFAGAGK